MASHNKMKCGTSAMHLHEIKNHQNIFVQGNYLFIFISALKVFFLLCSKEVQNFESF